MRDGRGEEGGRESEEYSHNLHVLYMFCFVSSHLSPYSSDDSTLAIVPNRRWTTAALKGFIARDCGWHPEPR